jgi:Zn-dependent membrane protease YugP
MKKLLSSISGQVLALSIGQAVVVAVLLFTLYFWSVQSDASRQAVSQANSIVRGAEAVRTDMAAK